VGDTGRVAVQAKDSISLNNGSQIRTTVEATARGNSQEITLLSPKLTLTNGAQVSASTSGQGNAGSIIVPNANSVFLSGSAISTASSSAGTSGDVAINTQKLTLEEGASISASTVSSTGGNITLNGLDTLKVNNSLISASTQTGTAGNLTVNSSDSVDLKGTGGLSVEATNGGTAGNLIVNTSQMIVRDGAQVSVSSPSGQAGNLNISANNLLLSRGTLSAETGTSGVQGGANITLSGLDFLIMGNESLISANATGNANGGNITIDSQFIIATSPRGSQGSDIVANAFRGNGGIVNITTQNLFGIRFRPIRTPKNDITANSQLGAAGRVTVNQLAVDPSQGLGALPQTLVDVEGLINQDVCKQAKQGSAFTVTGRGGTPENPKEILSPEAVVVEWATPLAPQQESNQQSTTTNLQQANLPLRGTLTLEDSLTLRYREQPSTPPGQLVEAQGWIIAPDGTVILTANPPNATPHATGLPIPSCQSRR
jgi:large exoprotein involved in heme utilization and adhesion